jgi:hypothetical protein
MSNKYNNGIIYKIVCEDGHYYFGSTTQLKLNIVFNNHKCLSKNKTCRLYEHIHIIGWDKVKIELVEKYPCKNKKELNKKEEEYINKNDTDFFCLNNDIEDNISDNISDNNEIIYESDDNIDTDNIDADDYESIYSTDSDNNAYQYGKIYKLISKDNHYYIGSTTKTLQERFSAHKYSIKHNTRDGNYSYFRSIPIEDISIELIENYPCSSKNKLREREDYYIQNALYDKYCLNTYRAFQTDEDKKEYDKLYYVLNKNKATENMKKYYEENKEKIIEQHKVYVEENREIINQKRAEYRKENAEILNQKQKEYAKNHIEQIKNNRKQYYEKNKEIELEKQKEYNKKNKDKINQYKNEWARKKRKENAEEKIKQRELKKQARIEHDNTIIQCECGGSYQNYRKQRHEESKKHQNFIKS